MTESYYRTGFKCRGCGFLSDECICKEKAMGGAHTINDPDRPAAKDWHTASNVRDHTAEEKQEFKTGAVCTKISERYDLICPTGLRRIAMRYALGAVKYSDYNWCKGIPIKERLNHLIKHLNEYVANGNKNDDNLAAIAWNAIALMHYEEDCKHHEAPWVEKEEVGNK